MKKVVVFGVDFRKIYGVLFDRFNEFRDRAVWRIAIAVASTRAGHEVDWWVAVDISVHIGVGLRSSWCSIVTREIVGDTFIGERFDRFILDGEKSTRGIVSIDEWAIFSSVAGTIRGVELAIAHFAAFDDSDILTIKWDCAKNFAIIDTTWSEGSSGFLGGFLSRAGGGRDIDWCEILLDALFFRDFDARKGERGITLGVVGSLEN